MQPSFVPAADEPRIYVIDGLFNASECAALMERAAPRLEAASVQWSGGRSSLSNKRREASTAMLDFDAVTATWRERMARQAMLPATHAEGLQVTRYASDGSGQRYELHHDSKMEVGRLASVIVFLTDVHKGGELLFPWARPLETRTASIIDGVEPWAGRPTSELPQLFHEHQGFPPIEPYCNDALAGSLKIAPRIGRAVVFYNHAPDLKIHGGEALHGGCPPLSDDKWIAQTWVRWYKVDEKGKQTHGFQGNELFTRLLGSNELAWRLPVAGPDPPGSPKPPARKKKKKTRMGRKG